MTECPRVSTCPFFRDQMEGLSAVAGMLKDRYCRAEFAACARYRVAVAGVPVPGDLYPNQTDRAAQIIGQ